MKTRILTVFILSVALSTQPAIQTTNAPTNPELSLLPIIMLTAVVAGTLIIVKAYKANGGGGVVPRLCLEKSTDHGSWSVVCCRTNVILNGTNPITVFTEEMTDTAALYRAKSYPQ